MVYQNKSGRFDALDPAFVVFASGTSPDGGRRMQTTWKEYLNQFFAISKILTHATLVSIRLADTYGQR